MSRELLERTLALMNNADMTTGVCCCGDNMDDHNAYSNHAAVDSGLHYAEKLTRDIKFYLDKEPL